ncbi:helix-turn-helix domain-containing protein [Marinibacterium sp. SX1]|uniref:helix-turn-helix domain-containing protein n=1 Tax=Marinibacterium sp. SX1 TaxID=3388424 RepID=UPI003D176843
MARESLTGSRIRERRSMAGLKQADLARQIGISASYLNLIEHNRRRIGGKLLVNIAQALGVEPSMLTEGAEATLIATLREAAADAEITAEETDRADEFAGRFPAWAEVLAGAHRRIASLERTVQILSDRLTHDPHLAASVHELLSTAAAIRSTASILAEPGELEREWRDRFHRNLNEDSLRLAESCKALVDYLDESGVAEERRGVPQEELEAFVAASAYHYPALEVAGAPVEALVQDSRELTTGAARQIATDMLTRYAADARRMPLDRMREALDRVGFAPLALAEVFATDLASVLRRLAAMPGDVLPDPAGLVICDGAGSLLFRKPVDGFAVPRFGATCPLWPLFSALARPAAPLKRLLTQEGRGAAVFDAFAISQPVGQREFNRDPLYQATMLVRRVPGGRAETAPDPVGSTCRVCPRSGCPARREPSILSEGF